ncbi:MAG: pilus assembly protein PilM [Planctomycetota bacterium]
MGKAVGLEIHPRGVRAVELSGTAKKVRIQRYEERTVTSRGGMPDPEELNEALASIFKSMPKNAVVACVDAHDTVTREIPVPFTSDDQIKKVVKYEAEHHLHDCDADDVIVQFAKIQESTDGTNLLVFAAKKEDIRRRIDACRDAGVELLALDLDAIATLHAVQAAGVLAESPDTILLHINHRSTDILFIQEGKLRALRSVRMGVDSIAQGLARDMDIEFNEADEKLLEIARGNEGDDLIVAADGGLDDKVDTEKSHAELERDLFRQKRDEFVARLKREYVRSSAALRTSASPRMLVTGPGIRVPGLVDLLSERLGRTIDMFLPSDYFDGKTGNDQGDSSRDFDGNGTVALGLALAGVGAGALPIDFRQEDLKVANKFELLKGTLAVSVTLLFLALMAASFYFVKKKKDLQGTRDDTMFYRIQTDAYKPFNEIVGKFNGLGEALVSERMKLDAVEVENGDGKTPHHALKRFNRALRKMQKHLNKIVGETGVKPIRSSLNRWNAIMGVVGKVRDEKGYVDIDSIDLEQDTVRLTAIVDSATTGELLQKNISELPEMEGLESPPSGVGISPIAGSNYGKVRLEWKEAKR